MAKLLIDLREDDSASIWDRELGRQYVRVTGSDGTYSWLKRTLSGFRAVSAHQARRLERAYRQRAELESIRRYPRRNAEDIAFFRTANRIADLKKRACEWIARGHEANIELGRIFNEIKALLNHGEWKPYVAEHFTPRGIPLRTATEYMRMAREAHKVTKKADSALYPAATDPQAQALGDANNKAEAAVAAVSEQSSSSEVPDNKTKGTRKKRARLDGIYKLPLHMTGGQKDATDLLLESKKWPKAERKIMDLLHRMHVKYGLLNDSASEEKNESN